ncbi:TetR/AcrR family transcriptional regulator [Lapillicoccus jejuensis]|uniref:TetR family transcriptional regulator n=1 Tax=Lapillicoccus jejuensis TaxID=402171 RepID=A0A542DVT3_9MICO|nr:TetR family transcriptional regulator C-terminal domain-containing protein [Lapillicoccus jejuensis]TQJ07024.1 TetR family transcriptional regulator [Lapillicoccus jejuensis]
MPRVPATERRPLLAAAALRVLARDGLAAVTTRAVVAEAGMKLASFHYVYDSRTELLRDLVAGVVEGEREGALAGLADVDLAGLAERPDAAAVEEVLLGCLRGYLALVVADPGREQGMFELTQHALREPTLDGLAGEQYAHYHALVAELLDELGARLGVTWDADLADLARLVVALTDGLTLAWLADRDAEATERTARLAARAVAGHAVLAQAGAAVVP